MSGKQKEQNLVTIKRSKIGNFNPRYDNGLIELIMVSARSNEVKHGNANFVEEK